MAQQSFLAFLMQGCLGRWNQINAALGQSEWCNDIHDDIFRDKQSVSIRDIIPASCDDGSRLRITATVNAQQVEVVLVYEQTWRVLFPGCAPEVAAVTNTVEAVACTCSGGGRCNHVGHLLWHLGKHPPPSPPSLPNLSRRHAAVR